jgi:hypothetical protein
VPALKVRSLPDHGSHFDKLAHAPRAFPSAPAHPTAGSILQIGITTVRARPYPRSTPSLR